MSTQKELLLEKLSEGKKCRNLLICEVADSLGVQFGSVRRRLNELVSERRVVYEPSDSGMDVCLLADDDVSGLTRENERLNQELTRMVRARQITSYKFDGETIRFGSIGDTQLGSRYENLVLLNAAYDIFADEDIDLVLHPGDLLDGEKMYRGHEYELHTHGSDAQVAYCVDEYPKREGIITEFILGNHDRSFWKHSGTDVGLQIEYQRDDMHYLGMGEADVTLSCDAGDIMVRLSHPGKGTSYAICFDDKTEILTENGWLCFSELDGTERVATLNPENHFFEWQQPTDYINERYNGNMLHFKESTFDLKITPNHRLYVRRYDRNKRGRILQYPQKVHRTVDYSWHFETAEDVAKANHKQTWQMLRNCAGFIPDEVSDIPDDLVKLCAWYVTEGCGHKNGKQIVITQSPTVNPENYMEICAIIANLGYNFGTYGGEQKDICISNKELTTWLCGHFGHISREKRLPLWVKNLPKSQLLILLHTMIKGDGWANGNSYAYKSISKRLCDDVQEIAIKCGYGSTVGAKDQAECFTVGISTVQNEPTVNDLPRHIQYDGMVYCVTVPNGVVLVRRNGRAIWSGNSYQTQKYIEALTGGHKPNMLLTGHFHKQEHIFYRNIQACQTGCAQHQTPFMRERNLAAIQGFYIIELTVNESGISRCKTEWMPCYD